MLQRVRASKNLTVLRYESGSRIDVAADAVRLRFATAGKHQIYADKREEAERFTQAVNNGSAVNPDDYPYLVAESQEDGETITDLAVMTDLATTWLTMNKAWKRAAAQIERITIRAKRQAATARGQTDLDTIVENAITSLNNIGTPLPERPKPDPGPSPGQNNPVKPFKTGDFSTDTGPSADSGA